MVKIKALRQFSHFHAGNFSQGEQRPVSESAAKALIGMGLAEEVKSEQEQPKPKRRAKKNGDDD